MALYKTKGIVLKIRPFEETAKLVTIFTKDFGKIKAIAKGAKRPTSKFGGRIEPLTLLDLSIAEGRNLDILSQCETIDNFPYIRTNPDYLKTALYFLRVINKATDDKQKNPNLFKLIILSLKKLNEPRLFTAEQNFDKVSKFYSGVNNRGEGEDIEKTIKYFEVNFLRVEGLFRKDAPPDILIGEHLGEDVRPWKT